MKKLNSLLILLIFSLSGCSQDGSASKKSEVTEIDIVKLNESFDKNKSEVVGKTFKLEGITSNKSVVESAGKKTVKISIGDKDGKAGVTCELNQEPKNYESLSEIKIKGMVAEEKNILGEVVLKPCEII